MQFSSQEAQAEIQAAIREAVRSLENLSATFARFGEPERDSDNGESNTRTAKADRVARLLSRRLGEQNAELIRLSAEAFEPGEVFSLTDLAATAGVTTRTARARLMNVGRSLKSLDGRGVLWTGQWDDEEGQMAYSWTSEGREAVLREFT
jgi:hypothetical protein